MPNARSITLTAVAALAACTACKQRVSGGAATRSAGRGAPAYDVGPLLAALTPAARRELPGRIGAKDLGQLPYYELSIDVHPDKGRFDGRCKLYYRNGTGAAISLLPLLLHPNAPHELGRPAADSGTLTLERARVLEGPALTQHVRRPTLVELRFASPLAPGARVTIELEFAGTLRRLPAGSNDIFSQAMASLGIGASGSGASDYGLLARGDGIVTIASGYPMLAPYREGAFDVSPPVKFGDLAYNGLANYRARVSVPRGYGVVTNLADDPGPAERAGRATFTAVGAANRDFALVAAPGLAKASQTVGGVTVASHFLARDRAAGQRLLGVGVGALELFQRRFGPYPYAELDLAEATLVGGAGGVEFPGMVLIAGMFYRPPSGSGSPLAAMMRMLGGLGGLLGGLQGGKRPAPGSGAAQGEPPGLRRMDELVETMGTFTVAHEVAHQYFAGVIGSDCRRHPALDEPLAQFAAGAYVESVQGARAGVAALRLNAKMNYGVYRMLGGADMPAAQPVARFPSALAYAAIVYGKAPYFYVALRQALGAARFDRALRATVDELRFQLVTTERWLAALQRHAGGEASGVRRLAQRWLYGSHGDADLAVDDSGDAVLGAMLGADALVQLKRGMKPLGMQPRDLFRMLMGKMMPEAAPAAGAQPRRSPLEGLLEGLLRGGAAGQPSPARDP